MEDQATPEEMPEWFHVMQAESLEDHIERQLAQRMELVRWIENIDKDVAAKREELAYHESKIS